MSDKIVKSACGAANLLAAVFGGDAQHIQEHLGLRPVRQLWRCPVCDAPIPAPRRGLGQRHFCSPECRHRWSWPLVECEECHKLKEVKQSELLIRAKTNKHFYCSHKCKGAYLGRTYGFTAHPENCRKK